MYIYPESLFNTLYIEIKNSFGKCPSDKINVTNMHSIFCKIKLITVLLLICDYYRS